MYRYACEKKEYSKTIQALLASAKVTDKLFVQIGVPTNQRHVRCMVPLKHISGVVTPDSLLLVAN